MTSERAKGFAGLALLFVAGCGGVAGFYACPGGGCDGIPITVFDRLALGYCGAGSAVAICGLLYITARIAVISIRALRGDPEDK